MKPKAPTVFIECKSCHVKWEMNNPIGRHRMRHWLKISKHYWKDIDWKEKTFTCSKCSD